MRIVVRSIDAQKIREFEVIEKSTLSLAGVADLDAEVGVGVAFVRRTGQNFRCAQFVRHHSPNLVGKPRGNGPRIRGGVDHRVGRAAFSGPHQHGETVAVIQCPGLNGKAHLFQVIRAVDALSTGLGAGQCRQQHSRQYGDDGNHDEQLDQREGPYFFA